jgi:Protein of unknown function (DUF3574)
VRARTLAACPKPFVEVNTMHSSRFALAAALALACCAPLNSLAHDAAGVARWPDARCDSRSGAQAFARTELFFGLSRPGGVITEADFKAFVDASVTPRFPDGLTLLSGIGQFRDASGTTIVEGSKLLILLYPRSDAQAGAKVEAIRSDYRHQFQQESVLRTDAPSCVSF